MAKTRVLVIDDNQGIRNLLRSVAELTDDFEVVGEAENGELGVAAAQWLKPDLVILDVNMPIMDGFTAYPKIRKACPNTSIVMLTAFEREVIALPPDVTYVNKNGEILWIFDELRKAAA